MTTEGHAAEGDSPVNSLEAHDFRQKITELIWKQEIYEVLARYLRGVDRNDFDLIRSCYHDDAIHDQGASYRGSIDGFITFLQREHTAATANMHMIGNVLIEFAGDVALSEAYLLVLHAFTAEYRGIIPGKALDTPSGFFSLVGARYVDKFERRGGEWKIQHRQVVLSAMAPPLTTNPEYVTPGALMAQLSMEDVIYTARREMGLASDRPC
jgi:SnoaL-like domain